MAKRVADEQITKDGFEGSPYDESDDAPGAPLQASSDVLSKRKILKPRGRLGTQQSSGFNGFGNVSKPQSSLFGFGNGSTSTTGAAPAPAPAPAANPFGFVKQASTSTPQDAANERNNKIRALNENFVKAINKLNVPNTIADFTSAAQKYIDYYKSILDVKPTPVAVPTPAPVQPPSSSTFQFKPNAPATTTTTTTTTPAFSFKPSVPEKQEAPKPTGPLFSFKKDEPAPKPIFSFNPPVSSSTAAGSSNVSTAAEAPSFAAKPVSSAGTNKDEPIEVDSDSESEDEEEEEKEVKVEGPKFTLTTNPTVKSSPFTFDPKKLAKKNAPDSDELEDEIEIKGPTFQFNKPIKDSVFKLNSTDSAKPFSFGAKKPEEEKKDEQSVAAEKKDEPKPAFIFGKPVESTTENKPVFAFGSAPKETKPAFGFGAPATEKKDNATPFTFGAAKPQEQPSSTETKPPAPAVSFGSSTPSAPLFKFGVQTDKPAESTTTTTTPAFNFKRTTTTSAPAETKPASAPTTSLFGAGSDKPAFSFSSTTSKPFNFGTPATTEKKAESAPAQAQAQAPATSTTPGFNFGTTTSTPSSGFSFGSSTPAGGFSFSKKTEGDGQSGNASSTASTFGLTNKPASSFSFGGAKQPESQRSTTDGAGESEDKTEEAEEEETGGNFTPVAKLSGEKVELSNGEEHETVKFSIRSKLMEFDTSNKESPYVTKGVGELRVLLDETTQKARLLLRADGGFRVLLNAAISKGINYESMGNGSLVRIPAIDPGNAAKIITYVAKVKTPLDGEKLLEVINELKK
ncbi:Nucleoporin NUP2 [Candida viswanathii]|uniref:Nucleoporin NUP2 n=1 Tax=Candida viswanathii TaxID=5486 RepID=A0A367YGA1_9ASCO|nr:Nucleoporin NUP2 [Candida viswanathii]